MSGLGSLSGFGKQSAENRRIIMLQYPHATNIIIIILSRKAKQLLRTYYAALGPQFPVPCARRFSPFSVHIR